MANATRTALADLYTTILDMAYHPNRYGNAAMREEREAQLNRIRSYMDDRYKQIAAFEDWRKNRRAERYLSTVEKNKQNFLMQGGSLEDFYKKQRDAIMKDKYFQNLAPEEQHNILNSFGKRSADAAGRLGLSTNDWDRGDDLRMQSRRMQSRRMQSRRMQSRRMQSRRMQRLRSRLPTHQEHFWHN